MTAAAAQQSVQNGSTARRLSAAYAIWYLRVVAALNLLGAVFAAVSNSVHRHNEGDFFTPYLLTAGFTSAAVAWFMAVTMRRRKRVAWLVNLILVTPTFLIYVLALSITDYSDYRAHWTNWLATAVTGLLFAALLVGRKEFQAKGDRNNPKLAAATLLLGLAVAVGIGTLLVTWFGTTGGSSVGERVRYTVLRVISIGASDSRTDALMVPRWVAVVINLMSLVLFFLVVYALFRSPRGRRLHSAEDDDRLRALLDKHGARDSLGYFALREDKSVIFSPTGKSAIAYRVVGGVSLASGDPLGDPEAWPGAIDAWLAEAYQHSWTPAVVGASEDGGTVLARHGLTALELGDEAVVETADFTLEGRAMRVVRQAYNRIDRAGYTASIRRHADIPPEEFEHLLKYAEIWRYGETERGFSMALGRLGDPDDGQCVLVECRDASGRPRALLSYVPWGPHGLSLDLMRRDKDSDNGLIEFMVIELIQRAEEVGVKRISLNFAMFRAVFERGSKLGAGPVLRLWRTVLLFFSRWWQLESLYRANAKYRPIWEPRFVLYTRSADLPRIGVAYARAEGFLAVPSLPSPSALIRRRRAAAPDCQVEAAPAETQPALVPGVEDRGEPGV
ncbi:MAG TPA: phosphatidylglycerol lysyltransferase domain-containing protein [Actinocrinis sp.]|nr:phosphatidylglycerol lysyltransferase domain-containing protein [Actinocrinis sp.]